MRVFFILILAFFTASCRMEQAGVTQENTVAPVEKPVVYEAGFDCRKASSKLEKTVCADKNLASSDKNINENYKRLIAACPDKAQNVNKLQKRWKQLAEYLLNLNDKELLKSLYSQDMYILRAKECDKIDFQAFEKSSQFVDVVLQKGKAFENPAKLRRDVAALFPNVPAAIQWLLTTMIYFPAEVGSVEYDRVSEIVLNGMKTEAEREERVNKNKYGGKHWNDYWREYDKIKDDPNKCFRDKECLAVLSGELRAGLIPCAEYIKRKNPFSITDACAGGSGCFITDNSTCDSDPVYQWPKGAEKFVGIGNSDFISFNGTAMFSKLAGMESDMLRKKYVPDFTKGKNLDMLPYTKRAVMSYDNFVRQQELLHLGAEYDKALTQLTEYYQRVYNVPFETAKGYALYLLEWEEAGALKDSLWYSVLYDPIEIVAQKIKAGNLSRPEPQEDHVCEMDEDCFFTYNAAPLPHLAVGRADVLKLLSESGLLKKIGVNEKDERKRMTALHVAAKYGFVDSARVLLDNGADVNAVADGVSGGSQFMYANLIHTERNRTPLMYAAKNGHLEMIRLLLDKGADKSKTDQMGMTAFDYLKAAKMEQTDLDMARELLKPENYPAVKEIVSKEIELDSDFSLDDSRVQDGKKLILVKLQRVDPSCQKGEARYRFFEYLPDTNAVTERISVCRRELTAGVYYLTDNGKLYFGTRCSKKYCINAAFANGNVVENILPPSEEKVISLAVDETKNHLYVGEHFSVFAADLNTSPATKTELAENGYGLSLVFSPEYPGYFWQILKAEGPDESWYELIEKNLKGEKLRSLNLQNFEERYVSIFMLDGGICIFPAEPDKLFYCYTPDMKLHFAHKRKPKTYYIPHDGKIVELTIRKKK